MIERELALVKIALTDQNRSEVLQVLDHFGAHTSDLTQDAIVVQVVGDSARVDAFIALSKHYGLLEISRTGKLVVPKLSS